MDTDRTGKKLEKPIEGESGMLYGMRTKRRDEKITGLESFEMKATPAVAKSAMQDLNRFGMPIIAQVEVDIKGSGQFAKAQANDYTLVGRLDQVNLDFEKGLTKREQPAK